MRSYAWGSVVVLLAGDREQTPCRLLLVLIVLLELTQANKHTHLLFHVANANFFVRINFKLELHNSPNNLKNSSEMGRIFLKHIGGQRLYVCAGCETPLTNRSQLLSTRFTGATGRAFLFNIVVNLTYRYVLKRFLDFYFQ